MIYLQIVTIVLFFATILILTTQVSENSLYLIPLGMFLLVLAIQSFSLGLTLGEKWEKEENENPRNSGVD